MTVNKDDYAIIIGLDHYPALGGAPLSAAEKDARDFEEWVINTGNVKENNIKHIFSSAFTVQNNGASPYNTKPSFAEVAREFRELSRQGPNIGRRLYIFMSGHGIAPTPYGNKVGKESALLMPNADPANITAVDYHIPGIYAATWFCENDAFEEVFLFMDCCRDITTVPCLNVFLPIKGNANNAKWYFAFACKWSRRSRELMIDGHMQGVFTKTLMTGLRGAAAEPDPADPTQGIITGASLKSFLYQNMKEYMDPAIKNDTRLNEPDVDYWPKAQDARDIVIVKGIPLQKFAVIIKVPAQATGEICVMGNAFIEFFKTAVDNPPQDIPTSLPRGKYLAEVMINGFMQRTIFDVKGIEKPGSEAIVEFII